MTTIDWISDAMGTGEYADINGLQLYYETHGTGRPLILLHGGLASSEMFGRDLAGSTHYNFGVSPLFAAVTLSFLDAPSA